ncbi:MAG: efflux RND transporter periplasmic adaptor subunit [Flavobacteriia bacterium]|nr:efflux RND transporter periplasmic adaptor subunit [Flavobacteriia bacterium]
MRKFLILLSIPMCITVVSCGSDHEVKHEESTYTATHPIVLDTNMTREYVCQIHSISHIEVRAQERGYIQKIFVDEGQLVKKGQLLFQIMPNLYQAELAKARAEANFAEIELNNTKSLADSGVVSSNELAMAQSKYAKAEAELYLAQTHLNFTNIVAPFDGLIDKLDVRLGSLVDDGDLLTHLSDNSDLWVYFNVPEAEYLDYITSTASQSKETVRLKMANGKIFNELGVVSTIEADFDHETGNIQFRATFPNPNGILRHGETGNILMSTPLNQAMIIPQKATFEILDKKYVFVINRDNILETREIKIGEELPHLYVVTGGLSTDDTILLEGLRRVRAGEEVHVDLIDPEVAINGLELYAE